MFKRKTEKFAQTLLQANCFAPLPTGKTIAERFNFGKKPNFLAVFGSGVNKPLQLNYLASAPQVVKLMRPAWATGAKLVKKVVYLKDFDDFKGRQRAVVMLGAKMDKRKAMSQMISRGLQSVRGLKSYLVDSSFYHLGLEKEFAEAAPKEESEAYGEAVCFLKVLT